MVREGWILAEMCTISQCGYFNSNDVQSVHSYIVGFDSCVPTTMLDKAQ